MAPHPHRARGSRGRGWCSTYGRLEFLPGRSVEAGAVDLLCSVLDRPASVHSYLQAVFHAPQAIPSCGSTKGARGFLDIGVATGWTHRVPFQTRSVRLAYDGTHAV